MHMPAMTIEGGIRYALKKCETVPGLGKANLGAVFVSICRVALAVQGRPCGKYPGLTAIDAGDRLPSSHGILT